MIDLQKSAATVEIAQLLETAKGGDDANVYRDGPVYELIRNDFHGKCYLCEDNEVTAIQIDHLEPHRGDRDKKYDWRNLFFSCAHCNNLKGDRYWPLLNCTDPGHQVWRSIELVVTKDFPKVSVDVIGHPSPGQHEACDNTRQLLDAALSNNATTQFKREEAAILRKKMLRASDALNQAVIADDEEAIQRVIANDAPFAGLCRWTLKRDYPALYTRLGARYETPKL